MAGAAYAGGGGAGSSGRMISSVGGAWGPAPQRLLYRYGASALVLSSALALCASVIRLPRPCYALVAVVCSAPVAASSAFFRIEEVILWLFGSAAVRHLITSLRDHHIMIFGGECHQRMI
jgi:hypothetical protein